MKKMRIISRRMLLVIGVYIVASAVLLGTCNRREQERALYTMQVTWFVATENLGDMPTYRQGFYAPGSCSGIQLCMATDETEAQRDLVVDIYEASSGELMGEHIVTHDRIGDNQYVDVMFEDYILENGKQYYFEAYTIGEGENPIRFWMGTAGSDFCLDVEYMGNIAPDLSIVFNLIYDYTDKYFVIWIFVSVGFLFLALKMNEMRNEDVRGKISD